MHVCADTDAPGYEIRESAGSKRGQRFTVGDGGKLANQGEFDLNLEAGNASLKSPFQVAKATRPLMSVGKICDQGHTISFDAEKAIIRNAVGREVARFERRNGGLYTAKMVLKAPFGRSE